LKIPPQADVREFDELPILHLIHSKIGGCHMTYMIWGALGGCTLTLNFFRMIKSAIADDATVEDWLPMKALFAMIEEIELFQWKLC